MVQKRQLCEDGYDASPKHLKLEHNCDSIPYLQFDKDYVPLLSDKDGGCFYKPNLKVEKEVDCTFPGRLPTSSWTSSTISEEDAMSAHASDAYSYLLERSPVKQVPIGPEYQADLPEFHECKYNGDEIKLMGSTIIPMPENETEIVAKGRIDCHCQDRGSIVCIKRHIKESRDVLKERIGFKTFEDLGFDDMGEVVAEKWSEDDEQLFHDVVYSNPVPSGRNFWKHLAVEFPSRSSQEIVSYYFNVFMLRRRTEQNRVDPMNADSDDDESQEYDCNEIGNGIENYSRKLNHSRSFDSISEKTIVDDESGDGVHDLSYDSCTSSDTPGTNKVNKSWVNDEFTFEPLDSRVWDIGYLSSAGRKTDFLPIEEVFGVESWNFEAIDDDNKTSN